MKIRLSSHGRKNLYEKDNLSGLPENADERRIPIKFKNYIMMP